MTGELDRLIEAMETGEITRAQMEDMTAHVFSLSKVSMDAAAAYATDDLNSAKALHDALLPDRYVRIEEFDDAWTVTIPRRKHAKVADATSESGPARAWLIAILKAYRDANS